MTNANDAGANTPKEKGLSVQVRYVAVSRPFVEKIDPGITLSAFKPTVLKFFDLVEGSVDGGTKVYNFVFDKKIMTDLNVKLGSMAEHELKLGLIEQLIQG